MLDLSYLNHFEVLNDVCLKLLGLVNVDAQKVHIFFLITGVPVIRATLSEFICTLVN